GGHVDLHSFPTRRSSDLRDVHELDELEVSGGESGCALVGGEDRMIEDFGDGQRLRRGGIAGGEGGLAQGRPLPVAERPRLHGNGDRKSTRLNSSHVKISY